MVGINRFLLINFLYFYFIVSLFFIFFFRPFFRNFVDFFSPFPLPTFFSSTVVFPLVHFFLNHLCFTSVSALFLSHLLCSTFYFLQVSLILRCSMLLLLSHSLPIMLSCYGFLFFLLFSAIF